MVKPQIPENESLRLSILNNYKVLDTIPELAFDSIVELASQICQTPIALVSLVDAERQWFKAKKGLSATETHRDISFCGHAILADAPFIVENASEDPRFSDNPLVTDGLKIRFYAGAPLVTSHGDRLGTLCVIAPEPKKLTEEQIKSLQSLAHLVIQQLELRMQTTMLSVANQAATEATEAKAAFLANISHEIRTPLNGIIGMAELLMDSEMQSDQKRFAEIISFSGNSLLNLVNDILDLSKIESGGFDLETIDFSLSSIVESQLELLAPKAAEKKIRLKSSFDQSLPAKIQGDPFRISQILLNLVGNAIKFTDQGTVSINVFKNDLKQLRIEVIDSGIGISTESQKNLFKPFSQADASTTRKYGGTGLGLSICKNLVERMGGNIGLNSNEGEGSTFWFELPLIA